MNSTLYIGFAKTPLSNIALFVALIVLSSCYTKIFNGKSELCYLQQLAWMLVHSHQIYFFVYIRISIEFIGFTLTEQLEELDKAVVMSNDCDTGLGAGVWKFTVV